MLTLKQIEVGKLYLTKHGYVVKIIEDIPEDGSLRLRGQDAGGFYARYELNELVKEVKTFRHNIRKKTPQELELERFKRMVEEDTIDEMWD